MTFLFFRIGDPEVFAKIEIMVFLWANAFGHMPSTRSERAPLKNQKYFFSCLPCELFSSFNFDTLKIGPGK